MKTLEQLFLEFLKESKKIKMTDTDKEFFEKIRNLPELKGNTVEEMFKAWRELAGVE
jgi:hypothetical protein